MYGDERGYVYGVGLVAVPDDARIHFMPDVKDMVWFLKLKDARLLDRVPMDAAWPYAAIYEDRPGRAVCGAELLGPFDQAYSSAEHCERCMEAVSSQLEAGRERLAALWVEHWPDLPREIALAEYQAGRA